MTPNELIYIILCVHIYNFCVVHYFIFIQVMHFIQVLIFYGEFIIYVCELPQCYEDRTTLHLIDCCLIIALVSSF